MNRTQQSTAIVICLLGLAVLAVGGVFLVREWREEVAARERLEEENARLRYEIDQLKAQSQLGGSDRIQASLGIGQRKVILLPIPFERNFPENGRNGKSREVALDFLKEPVAESTTVELAPPNPGKQYRQRADEE